MTTRRNEKPIGLKTLAAKRGPDLAGMLSQLEGASTPRRPSVRPALWTQAFLASGKLGKSG